MTEWLVPTIMGVQAVLLALISRLRFGCLPDAEGKCICMSGCTEGQLVSSDSVDAHEYEVGNGQRVLVVSAKTEGN